MGFCRRNSSFRQWSGPYTVSWPDSGSLSVTLVVTENSCTSTTSNNPLTVTAIPNAAMSIDPSACPNEQKALSFIGSPNTGAIFTWDFGSANIISGSGAHLPIKLE